MKTIHFPYIALALSLFLLPVVVIGREIADDGSRLLPLLTLLLVSEFSFFCTAAGAYIGVKHMHRVDIKLLYGLATLLCAGLSIRFMLYGIELWPF